MSQNLSRIPQDKWLEHHIDWIFNQGKTKEKGESSTDIQIVMRALRNAWYNESSLIYPKDFEKRMQFPAWKIIQCYYSIFSSIVSFVRTFDSKTKGHDHILNKYSTLITKETIKKYFQTPINIYLKQDGSLPDEVAKWRYPSSYNYDYNLKKIVEALQNIRQQENKQKRMTIPHFLKEFRDWAAYQDGYIFCRLYGQNIKTNLDRALINICSAFLSQVEIILIKLYGLDTITYQYMDLSKKLEQYIGIRNTNLDHRFAIYEKKI